MKNVLFLGLVVAFFLTSCKRDIDIFVPDAIPEPPIPEVIINTTLNGIIVDEFDQPIKDALVKLVDETTTTDDAGVFILKNVEVGENRAYLSVSKTGYFHGSRALIAHENTSSTIKIKLLSNEVEGTISAVDGGEISLASNAKIKLPAEAVITSNGDTYNGLVNVAFKFLNPTSEDLGEMMPGDLSGINADGVEQSLATYGMMAIELTSDNGEQLNIAAEKMTILNFPVPSDLVASAPSSIPLWYFDEEDGFWREEGIAVLEGNVYIAQVSHFTFWNCDAPYPLTQISGKVVDEDNNSIAYTNVQISAGAIVGWGMTDDSGLFSGKVPYDEILTIEVNDECGNLAYTETIGPITESNSIIDDIVITNISPISVTGSMVDCNNTPVANGYVKVNASSSAYKIFFTDENGNFSGNFLPCDGSIQVQGIDSDNVRKSFIQDVDVTNDEQVNVGELQACVELETYVNFNIDGTDYLLEGVNSSLDGGETTIFSESSMEFFSLSFEGEDLDQYPALTDFASFTELYDSNVVTAINITIDISSYGDVGGYVGGTFSGTFEDLPTQTTHNISGSFRALRNF